MSAKTKIVVLHMKEVIYTVVFLVLALVLGGILFLMFGPGHDKETAAQADGNKAETHLKLLGKGTAHVFISDARGELTCYDKAFTWQPDSLWPGSTDGAWPSVGASVARVASSKNGARLRVDLEIEISGALFQAQSFDALCGVELGEEYDDSDGPALYIYYARQGERIFDIARRYHARARDLAAANHLDTNGDPPQELTTDTACLLIPAAL